MVSDDSVLAALARLEEGQTKMREELTQFRVDVMARFERVEDNLSEIRDDINVNMHRADRADDNASHARDELRTMWRAIQKLRTRVEELEGKGNA